MLLLVSYKLLILSAAVVNLRIPRGVAFGYSGGRSGLRRHACLGLFNLVTNGVKLLITLLLATLLEKNNVTFIVTKQKQAFLCF